MYCTQEKNDTIKVFFMERIFLVSFSDFIPSFSLRVYWPRGRGIGNWCLLSRYCGDNCRYIWISLVPDQTISEKKEAKKQYAK